MDAGDCFTLDSVEKHFWIIISDPKQNAERVVFVSLTTWQEDKDQTCIVERGEHPWVRRRSCVAFFFAREATEAQLLFLKDHGKLIRQSPASAALLEKIRRSALLSDEFKPAFLAVLQAQGFSLPAVSPNE